MSAEKKHSSMDDMAVEMIRFLQKWGLWERTRIFACKKSYDSDDDRNGDEYKGIPFVQVKENVNPADHVKSPYGADESFAHIFDMTFEGPLYDIFCDGALRTRCGMIDIEAWDYILEHSSFPEELFDSGEYGKGELLLSNIITGGGEDSTYSMWDPLKYEDYNEYLNSDEYERLPEPEKNSEEELIPAYTLFDTYAEYKSFLDGDIKLLRSNPVLWRMAVRMIKNLLYQELEDDEISITGAVVLHIREEFASIFEKYGLDYELIYNWMLAGIAKEGPARENTELQSERKREAAKRLRLLKVPEERIAAFLEDGLLPGVIQSTDGTVRWSCKEPESRSSFFKQAFHGNMPYFFFTGSGAIPMEACLYIEENKDEREMYRQELISQSAELMLSAVVFSADRQDYEYGSIAVKLTGNGPVRVG